MSPQKQYFVVPGDSANSYKLLWSEPADEFGLLLNHPKAKKITKKEAVRLAKAERQRRREDPSFSGSADEYVYPYGANPWALNAFGRFITDSSGCVILA